MSGSKCLAQNGDRPLNQGPVSGEFCLAKTVAPGSHSSSGEGNFCGRRQDDIWTSIQQDKTDTWSSIISQKNPELITPNSVPSPYLHPLVKRSHSSLSEKSLEICTESLGSETGWDGFSSAPSSETCSAGDQDKEEDPHQQKSRDPAEEDFRLEEYHHAAATEKVTPRPFPPPLHSLFQSDGPSLRMRIVLEDGRLVVEAVSVPSQKQFHAERQDGRLLLSFVHAQEQEMGYGRERVLENPECKEQEQDDMDDEFVGFDQYDAEYEPIKDEDEDAEVETPGTGLVIDDQVTDISILFPGVMNVPRSMLQPCLSNRILPWPPMLREVVKLKETAEEMVKVMKAISVAQLLSPRSETGTRLIPPPTRSVIAVGQNSLDSYSPIFKTRTQIFHQFIEQEVTSSHLYPCKNKFLVTENVEIQNDELQLMVLRGRNGESLGPMSKTCKESRTSVLYWQPYNCIAS